MNIAITSDLHLESYRSDKLLEAFIDHIISQLDSKDLDVIVLAGDISSKDHLLGKFFSALRKWNSEIFILFVPGNHEFYGKWKSIPDVNNDLKVLCDSFKIDFLNEGSCKVIKGVCWIGTTLWSAIQQNTYMPELGCLKHIKDFRNNQFNFLQRHEFELRQLEMSITTSISTPKVIISHYLPSLSLIDPSFAGSSLNSAFASDLDRLFLNKDIRLWIAGHTHKRTKTNIHQVPVIVWPLGYCKEYPEHMEQAWCFETI